MEGNLLSLLLVDDDVTFCNVLADALQKRGFDVTIAHSVEEALPIAQKSPPEFAIVDLKMSGASGLVLIKFLHELNAATRIVVLTGYASVATAVEAIKLGAVHYLSKPANTDEIVAAFNYSANSNSEIKESVLPFVKLEWEYLHRVLVEQNNNISSTARVLKMHRRTLQRKLNRMPPHS